jgi:hypothetical protein
MPKLIDWCDEAAVTHWHQEGSTLPGADEILRRMLTEGRLSKVRWPSADHALGRLAPPLEQPRFGIMLTPLRPPA